MQPELATTPCASAAGSAMQVGRGSSGAFAITPAPGGAFRNAPSVVAKGVPLPALKPPPTAPTPSTEAPPAPPPPPPSAVTVVEPQTVLEASPTLPPTSLALPPAPPAPTEPVQEVALVTGMRDR